MCKIDFHTLSFYNKKGQHSFAVGVLSIGSVEHADFIKPSGGCFCIFLWYVSVGSMNEIDA